VAKYHSLALATAAASGYGMHLILGDISDVYGAFWVAYTGRDAGAPIRDGYEHA
jgi:hypothetical protein